MEGQTTTPRAMTDEDKPAESESIASRFLFLTAITAGIFLGTHFISPELKTDVITPSQVAEIQAEMADEFKRKEDVLIKHIAEIQAKMTQELQTKEDDLKKQVAEIQAEVGRERVAKEDALTRLSAIISNRLRDTNSDIVDLSDPNRPEKIGVMYSELYNNQWTDAYEALESTFNKNENTIIEFLFNILKICFTTCQEEGEKELGRLRNIIKQIETDLTSKHTSLESDLMQRIKEERKLSGTGQIPSHDKITKLRKYFSSKVNNIRLMDQPDIKGYIQECLRICRLMVIQDPPMTLLFIPETNVNAFFRPYQNKGTQIDIVVWPALLLKEGGPCVSQGVAKFVKREM